MAGKWGDWGDGWGSIGFSIQSKGCFNEWLQGILSCLVCVLIDKSDRLNTPKI